MLFRSHTLQGPPASGSDGVISKKPTSKASNSSSAELDGLKKGTWNRAYTKSRLGLLLSLNNVLGAKRSGKEFSRETEKVELAKRKPWGGLGLIFRLILIHILMHG